MSKLRLLTVGALFCCSAAAQENCPELKDGAKERLRYDISYLASDELEGRKPGEKGAEMAAAYIEKEFRELELLSSNDTSYLQFFSVPAPAGFGENNSFQYDGKKYALREDYFPVRWSENGTATGKTIFVKYGITAPELHYDDYGDLGSKQLQGKIFVMDISSPDGIHPHSDYLKYHDIGERIERARDKGAKGVILVNLSESANDLSANFKTIHSRGIPVVFVTNNDLAEELKNDKKVSFTTDVSEKEIEAFNVLGLLDHNAPNTVVIGAHYDHLGYGQENSLYSGGGREIHNGADDNASGVAGLLELARNISEQPERYGSSNYLFAAFSAEESGLLGSSYFTDHPAGFRTEDFKFMINLDMIGRLEDSTLAVNGAGTSPQWKDLLNTGECVYLKIKTSESGIGPSDHTSFYYKDVPAIHLFTGTHKDYHKPSDDYDKINYEGQTEVVRYILHILQQAEEVDEFTFTPTKTETQATPRFSVTLGVMPDYMYEGEGMRIDGVTEGKPAAQAGLQKDDVVVHLGDVKVVDMNSYMKALAQFKKGDEAKLKYRRGEETFSTKVKF